MTPYMRYEYVRRVWAVCSRLVRHALLQVSSPGAQTFPQTLQWRWSSDAGTMSRRDPPRV